MRHICPVDVTPVFPFPNPVAILLEHLAAAFEPGVDNPLPGAVDIPARTMGAKMDFRAARHSRGLESPAFILRRILFA